MRVLIQLLAAVQINQLIDWLVDSKHAELPTLSHQTEVPVQSQAKLVPAASNPSDVDYYMNHDVPSSGRASELLASRSSATPCRPREQHGWADHQDFDPLDVRNSINSRVSVAFHVLTMNSFVYKNFLANTPSAGQGPVYHTVHSAERFKWSPAVFTCDKNWLKNQ